MTMNQTKAESEYLARISKFPDAVLSSHEDSKQEGFEYLFSHAGVCGQFEAIINKKYGLQYHEYDYIKVGQETKEFFYVSKHNGGYDSFDGPLWLRPNELKKDMPNFSGDVIQIFGHTYNQKMQIFQSDSLTFVNVDCDENLLINNNEFKTI